MVGEIESSGEIVSEATRNISKKGYCIRNWRWLEYMIGKILKTGRSQEHQ